MPSAATEKIEPNELSILARVLGNDRGSLPAEMARYFVGLGFSDRDKSRMHDLAVRNQAGSLSRAEREELFAYSKAGTLLSILKSRARRVLRARSRNSLVRLHRRCRCPLVYPAPGPVPSRRQRPNRRLPVKLHGRPSL